MPRALAELRAVAPATVPVVCFQNGVRAEVLAQVAFPRVYSLLTTFSAVYVRDGEVHTGYEPPAVGWLEIARFPTGLDALCGDIVDCLQAAGMVALRTAKVQPLKYGKLLGNPGSPPVRL